MEIYLKISEFDYYMKPIEEYTLLTDIEGLYVFYDKTRVPLYVGKAIKLRNRIRQHISETSPNGTNGYMSYIKYFSSLAVECPVERDIIETYMINLLKTPLNIDKTWSYDTTKLKSDLRLIKDERSKVKRLPAFKDGNHITENEINTIIDYTRNKKDYRGEVLIRLIWENGFKANEITKIKISDFINGEEPMIKLIKNKTNKMDCISITNELKECIINYINTSEIPYNKDFPLISSHDKGWKNRIGKPVAYSSIRHKIASLVKQAKINKYVTPDIIRQSAIKHAIDNNDISQALKLTKSNPSILYRYTDKDIFK